MDSGAEQLFSSRFACPVCSHALPELEPRLFSFNNPAGACPRVRRARGRSQFFDPKRVVPVPEPEPGLGRDQGLGPAQPVLLPDAAEPRGLLRLRHRHALRGAARAGAPRGARGLGQRERIPFTYLGEGGRATVREHAFEGVMPNLERRFRETESVHVREELAKFLQHPPLPDLRRHAAAPRRPLRARRVRAAATSRSGRSRAGR